MTLRLSELYTSVQGEGPQVGRPIQFVRFAGCNFRCPGWPCDTEFAIEPSIWRHQSEKLTAEQLFYRLPEYPKRLCLTGGEPFLQPNVELQEFCEMAIAGGYHVEAFTNGSFPFPDWAMRSMSFMMDWKLEGSGETPDTVRNFNAVRLRRSDGIKFVCVDIDDLEEAAETTDMLIKDGVIAQFWVAAAWDQIDNQSIVDFTMDHQLPWRLNVQIHKYLWHPDARKV